mmetsp:Transcript_3599/g.12475  ORF Transcript_3599/g.12475 Transcript_3599/m.12475 type:complete len:203 (-) Transcript_3599:2094-2702(-)
MKWGCGASSRSFGRRWRITNGSLCLRMSSSKRSCGRRASALRLMLFGRSSCPGYSSLSKLSTSHTRQLDHAKPAMCGLTTSRMSPVSSFSGLRFMDLAFLHWHETPPLAFRRREASSQRFLLSSSSFDSATSSLPTTTAVGPWRSPFLTPSEPSATARRRAKLASNACPRPFKVCSRRSGSTRSLRATRSTSPRVATPTHLG